MPLPGVARDWGGPPERQTQVVSDSLERATTRNSAGAPAESALLTSASATRPTARTSNRVWVLHPCRGRVSNGARRSGAGTSVALAGWQLRRGWLNHDNDLARGASLLDQPHSSCRVGERVGPVDDRSDTAGLDEVADLLEGLGGDLGGE